MSGSVVFAEEIDGVRRRSGGIRVLLDDRNETRGFARGAASDLVSLEDVVIRR